jgi:TolB-like protein
MKKILPLLYVTALLFAGLNAASEEKSDRDMVFRNLAGRISDVKGKLPGKTVAVYGFEIIGKDDSNYARYATEKLTHEIVSKGELMVIERSRIDQVLREQSLSLTGAVDSGTAARIGKILAVDAVIIGTIHISGGRTEFITRVIQSEKGVILLSVSEKMEKTEGGDDDSDFSDGDISGSESIKITGIKPVYDGSRQITVNFSGLPGNRQDWITLVRASEGDSTYGEWFYTGGVKSGTYSFKPVSPGEYEIRVYLNWPDGGYIVRKRIKIRVK